MHRLLPALLAIAAGALVLAACNSREASGGTGYSVTACSDSSTCATGEVCTDMLCLDVCRTDADCDPGAACAGGACYASRGTASCTTDSDCADPATGTGRACVAGSCVGLPPLLDCTADSDCPAGSLCDGGVCTTRDPTTCTPVAEVCGNGIDDDCDGLVDDGCTPAACTTDSDCPTAGDRCLRGTCYPPDPTTCTPVTEICGNGIDDDCDGLVDDGCSSPGTCSVDTDCSPGESCVRGVCTADPATCTPVAEICGNGIDDDCDGLIDDGCTPPTGTPCRTDSDCGDPSLACVGGVCSSR